MSKALGLRSKHLSRIGLKERTVARWCFELTAHLPRPCLIISPNEINHALATVIVAPMTTKGQLYPTRVKCRFQGKDGLIVLDQLRTVDKIRLVKRLGQISPATRAAALGKLAEMFAA